MKLALQSPDTGGHAIPSVPPADHPPACDDISVNLYELSRPLGMWVLLDVQTGVRRPYGNCTKEQALRRAANFLRNRPGKSRLLIRSKNGAHQSQRTYQGEEDVSP